MRRGPLLETWRDPIRRVLRLQLYGCVSTQITDRELREADEAGVYSGLVRAHLASLVFLAMPCHDEEEQTAGHRARPTGE